MSKVFYFQKIMKNIPLMLALNNPFCNYWCRVLANKLKYNYKEKAVSLARGF